MDLLREAIGPKGSNCFSRGIRPSYSMENCYSHLWFSRGIRTTCPPPPLDPLMQLRKPREIYRYTVVPCSHIIVLSHVIAYLTLLSCNWVCNRIISIKFCSGGNTKENHSPWRESANIRQQNVWSVGRFQRKWQKANRNQRPKCYF